MHASFHRCLAVVLGTTAIAAALARWLVPVAIAPQPGLDGSLVRLCAVAGTVASAWLWAAAVAVAVDALTGGSIRPGGVPAPVRRAVLAACGVAVVTGLATPAGAAPGRTDPPQTAASVVATALAGLPLPDRASGPPRRDGRAALARVVSVRPGDTLWAIAEEHLGSGDRWPEIYALNRAVVGADPDLIQPAQRLRLPHHPHEENR